LYRQRLKEEEEVARLKKEAQKKNDPVIEQESELDEKQKRSIQDLEDALSGKGSVSANKRILIEYRQLMTSKETQHIEVEFKNESNLYVWNARIDASKCDLSKDLKGDFEKYSKKLGKKQEIVFEIFFTKDFPFYPPFIRVVRPRFAFHTGHITIGGSICMEALTPSGWTVARNLESLFIEIISNMCHGGGRLDLGQTMDYTIHEAREAFERVARHHKWM